MNTIYKRFISILTVVSGIIILASSVGCSYISDSIEAAIFNRAGFSIKADYNGSHVIFNWGETGGSFAGYEIYRTREVNNEFSKYTMEASKWDPFYDSLLADYNTGFYAWDARSLRDSIDPTLGPGIYFFRIGIIKWDEDDNESSDWNLTGDRWDDTEISYERHTSINKVSGSALVDIY